MGHAFAHIPFNLTESQEYRRRICPGISLAERMVWLAFSRLLWAYDFEWEAGQEAPISGHTGGSPPPMHVFLSARDEKIRSMLEAVEETSKIPFI